MGQSRATCVCQAGEHGISCKHRLALLKGDTTHILSGNETAEARFVRKKIESLKSYAILKGTRGMMPADIDGYIDSIVRVSWILAEFPEIKELDINPLRLLKDGSGLFALDARMVVEKG